MAQSLVSVAFHGATLQAVLVNGAPYVSIRSLCTAIGLDPEGQQQRVIRHPVLRSSTCMTQVVAADGVAREMLCIRLDKLNGWLFGVDTRRARPELRERLVQYQRECFDVLAAHFGAAAGPSRVPTTLQADAQALAVAHTRAIEAAQAAAARVRRSVYRAMQQTQPGATLRLLVEVYPDESGDPHITARHLRDGEDVYTRQQLAQHAHQARIDSLRAELAALSAPTQVAAPAALPMPSRTPA